MITRRRVLRGAFGAMVALPVLESVRWLGRATAADPPKRVYSMFIRQGNGVQQAGFRDEPERFWPRSLGPLTKTSLETLDGDRTVSILADHAASMTLVRGTRFAFPGNACGHATGIVQCLTAANVSGSNDATRPTGPSVDWFIASRINPVGVDPLTMMSGPQDAYLGHRLSYQEGGLLRGARNNPWAVYSSLMGLSGSPEVLQQIVARRQSVNDLVRAEMTDLLGAPLSRADRQRLDMHFQAIRDVELGMQCTLPDNEVSRLEALATDFELNEHRLEVADLMLQLATLAFACDATRTGTLQLGEGNDLAHYDVNGALQNTFHRISHRIDSDGDVGEPIANADLLHHEIDKLIAGVVKRFLDRLALYPGPNGGSLLDDSVVLWTNDLGIGPLHSHDNIPQVVVGRAGGFLKTGMYIDAGNVTHNKLLNTIISAVGIRSDDSSYYDQFGDPSLERGVIDAMIA